MAEEKKEVVLVDINDMSLDSTEVEIDASADAFAYPPPPSEKGNPYRVKLTGDAKKWKDAYTKSKDGKPGLRYFQAPLEAVIVAPEKPEDGKILFDGGFLSTLPGPQGISRVAGLLKLIYEQRGQGETLPEGRQKQQVYAKLLQDEFDRETEIGVMIQWEAFCADDEKRYRGEKKFKPRADGTHQGTIECSACGGELQAQARIQRYVKL